MVGALESYYAFKDAQKKSTKICVTVFEKGESFDFLKRNQISTNTSYNIVPSLTIDEILSVVPRGSELIEKLNILFSKPGGIRVDDVYGVNDSTEALAFKEAVAGYGLDPLHDDRTLTLLTLGRKSMQLWQQMYDEGDEELRVIMTASNFQPCREPYDTANRQLRDGYRIDLMYGIPDVESKARNMKADYEKLGYAYCKILSPDEVVTLDPSLTHFCQEHSKIDETATRVWDNDAVALWRPGGCIDTAAFLPKFYDYLQKTMGQYVDANNHTQECFQLQFGREVTSLEFDQNSKDIRLIGLGFKDGQKQIENSPEVPCYYIFCPGESVGTLHRLGFEEPTYAAFAGASLLLNIPLNDDEIQKYKHFAHCMEVHKEGIVLAWQARFRENRIFIGVAGTKAFYGDKQPNTNEAFSKNRNLVQLNMINNVLPQFISLAFGSDTYGKQLSAQDLSILEDKGVAKRWVGRRAVAYDGFPTIGALYKNGQKVGNARCTTHLGSGGVSFGPGAVFISRCAHQQIDDTFIEKVLHYSDSRRGID